MHVQLALCVRACTGDMPFCGSCRQGRKRGLARLQADDATRLPLPWYGEGCGHVAEGSELLQPTGGRAKF